MMSITYDFKTHISCTRYFKIFPQVNKLLFSGSCIMPIVKKDEGGGTKVAPYMKVPSIGIYENRIYSCLKTSRPLKNSPFVWIQTCGNMCNIMQIQTSFTVPSTAFNIGVQYWLWSVAKFRKKIYTWWIAYVNWRMSGIWLTMHKYSDCKCQS